MVFTLSSGVTVLAKVEENLDTTMIVSYPFEMELVIDTTGTSRLYLSRYLPYSKDNLVILVTGNIESLCITSDAYSTYYHQKVSDYKALVSGDLDTYYTRPSDAGSNEPGLDDYDLDEEEMIGGEGYHSGNTTIH